MLGLSAAARHGSPIANRPAPARVPFRTMSFLATYQSELQTYLARASEMLGGSAVPVCLDWSVRTWMAERLKLEARRGLTHEPPILCFDRSRRGHELGGGMERYRWDTDRGPIRLVRVEIPSPDSLVPDFWAVRRDQVRALYRAIRQGLREAGDQPPPVVDETDLKRLFDNTVGFLRRGWSAMQRYGITPKRGVLLSGSPGNGKTMACRWLAGECRRRNLEWRAVTPEVYDEARSDRELGRLFRLASPGIVLFDDFDDALRDRRTHGESDRQTTFLSELDGVDQKSGVVYLFTTNADLDELDPAARRPGRIDVVIRFADPDGWLRRRLIVERWHEEIQAGIDVDRAVADTDGMSFAEMEEAKKLLVLRRLDTGTWDWDWVRREMAVRAAAPRSRRPIGFRAPSNGRHKVLAEN